MLTMKTVTMTFGCLLLLAVFFHCEGAARDSPTLLSRQRRASDCDSSPCQNLGLCIPLVSGFKCSCVGNWAGTTCTVPDFCVDPNTCKNGGQCTTVGSTFKCTCTNGYTGTTCEISPKSAKSDPTAECGCFSTNSTVLLESGQRIPIQDVSVGDRVLSFDNSGNLLFSEVAMWMDHVSQAKFDLVQVMTQTGKTFKATPHHVVLVGGIFTQMRYVEVGDELMLTDDGEQMHVEKVESISEIHDELGAFAPLTYEGTIVVDGVAASCYAFSHQLGQIVFAPMKLMSKLGVVSGKADGMHWYSRMLLDGVEALNLKSVLMH